MEDNGTPKGQRPKETGGKLIMGKVVLIPSLVGRYAKLIVACQNKDEILEIIKNMEMLYELEIFQPPDNFWPLVQKLVERKVALLSLNNR